eukprot:TRINITY_DN23747_c0_g1_i1.p1 TRINITY_DN23747_c0_g1~~TRINITY_DN23747_c0_g1_i1.p1  ORF type:complete len:1212 (+),score=259.94 TRINITY_DN23747_c0_g1_i1:71-3706(+)
MPLIVESAKRDLTAMVEMGRQKMQEGAYEHAIQHFSNALDMKPGFMQALVSRGFCYLTLGDEEHAQCDFAEVIHKDAGFNRNIYVLMALCLKRSGDYPTAIRYLSRCIGHFSNFKPALIARGELCLKVHDYERARADFRQVLVDEPVHLVARRGLADSLRGLGNFREALRHYGRAINDTLQALEHQQERDGDHPQDMQQNASMDEDADDNTHDDPYNGSEHEGEGQSEMHDRVAPYSQGNFDYDEQSEHSDSRNKGPSGSNQEDESGTGRNEEQMLADPEQLRTFLIELLMRRALLLRLVGNLEAAGSDLLGVLEFDPQDGLALFWYAKVLIEQQRHQEALPFLRASLQHHEPIRFAANALLGALLMTRPDPDFEAGQRHLKEAARISPTSQSVKVTLWICSAAVALASNPRDSRGALSLLDKALAALEAVDASGVADMGSGSRSARGSANHVAGSGNVAAAILSARSKSAEEARWSATRSLVKHQQELAQGDDLVQALQCRTFLQLVAREPQQRAAEVPSMLLQLRVTALCDLSRWEEAVSDCRRALVLDPGDETTQYTLHVACGILRSQSSKFEAAVGCFTKAIRLQPVSTEARLHRAIVLACAARGPGAGGTAQDTARVVQLLTDAVQDLEAVQQQAMIAGAPAPLGAAHLRAACLCSLGRPEDAWEVLCDSGLHCAGRRSNVDGRDDPSVPRQRALEAEVLVLLRRHSEAIEACSAVLALNSRGHTDALLMRGWCLSELGEVEAAFQDLNDAVEISAERPDVHEALGDLCLGHGRLSDAYVVYGEAVRRSEPVEARLAYKRALPQLALGQLALAQQELNRALRLNPQMASALRTKDGINALHTVLKEDWRHAHVRLNMMLHQGLPGADGSSHVPPKLINGLPVLFLPHELVVYRGVCSFYLGDISTAIQDFATALDLSRQMAAGAPNAGWSRRKCLPPEAASLEGLAVFECECIYNVALCHLRARDFRAALASVERLCERQDEMMTFGASALGLAWFLAGICHLALDGEGTPSESLAREAFSRSYSYEAAYVDDFLRRHGQSQSQDDQAPEHAAASRTLRPIGGPVPVRSSQREKEICDAAPEAVCCLCNARPSTAGSSLTGPEAASEEGIGETEAALDGREGDASQIEESQAQPSSTGSSGSRRRRLLSLKLPPVRLQVRDVVIWGRPSVSWPHVHAPEWTPPTSLARLDLLQQRGVPVSGGRGGA